MTSDFKLLDQQSETENIAESMLPYLMGDGIGDTTDNKRASYVAKRICGFTVRESCKMAGLCEKTIRRWREADETFARMDTEGLTELRKQLASNIIDMQFTRNFHMFLEKDFKVLYKDATEPSKLTDDDKKYLNRIRQYYTPQALAMVKQILGGGTVEEPFNFSKMVLRVEREKIEVRGEP